VSVQFSSVTSLYTRFNIPQVNQLQFRFRCNC